MLPGWLVLLLCGIALWLLVTRGHELLVSRYRMWKLLEEIRGDRREDELR